MKTRSKLTILFVVVALLIALRVAAPPALEYYLNEQVLFDLGDYSGHVENVDLAVWRGAVRLENVRVEKVTGNEWVRFLTVPVLELSLNPLSIFRGVVQAEILIERPELNFVDGEDEADKQTGAGLQRPDDPDDDKDEDEDEDRDPLFPLELAKLEIRQGSVAFRNFTSEPPVNLQAYNIDLTATYLAVDPGAENPPAGRLKVSADVLEGSPFSAEAEYQAQEYQEGDFRNFMFATELTLRDLTQLNSFARAYGKLDFNSGHGSLVMEVTAENGQLTGYANPAFEDVGIFDWEAEMEQGDTHPLQLMWEGFAGAMTQIFSNRETDTLATRIEISGEIPDSTDVSTWGAVVGIIRNAFVEAINTNFEHITPLDVGGEAQGTEAGEQAGEESTEEASEEAKERNGNDNDQQNDENERDD